MNKFQKSLGIKIIAYIALTFSYSYDLGLFLSVSAQEPVTADTIENLLVEGMERGIRGNYQGAIHIFTEIIKIDPQEIEAYYNRGIAYEKLNENQKAIADFNAVTNLNPNYGEAYVSRSQIYLKLSQKEAAILDLERALSLFEKQKNWPAYQWVKSQLALFN